MEQLQQDIELAETNAALARSAQMARETNAALARSAQMAMESTMQQGKAQKMTGFCVNANRGAKKR